MKEYLAQQANQFFQAKGLNFLPQLRQWLTNYQSLTVEQQENLEPAAEKIQEALEILEKGEQVTPPSEQTTYWSNLKWKTLAYYGGGIFLILLVLTWLWKQVKK
jgi:hypothetical protein